LTADERDTIKRSSLRKSRVPEPERVPALLSETDMTNYIIARKPFATTAIALGLAMLPLTVSAQTNEAPSAATSTVVAQAPATATPEIAAAADPAKSDAVRSDEARPPAKRGIRWGVVEGADVRRMHAWRSSGGYGSASFSVGAGR
jgi:hypothetical protein